MALSKEQVAKLYIAMFDRAPDGAGLDYWVKQAEANNWDAATLANSMASAAAQYADVYPEYSDLKDKENLTKIITEMYTTLLNKGDDTDGINYWVNDILENGQTLGQVAANIVDIADKTAAGEMYQDDAEAQKAAKAFENKVQAALDAADTISTYDIDGNGKFDSYDKDAFNKMVSVVTDDPASIEEAKKVIDDYTPKSFELTTGTDNIVGNDAANTFKAPLLTVNDGDTIDGKGGIDTLNMEINGNVSSKVTVSNVENINVTSYGSNQIDMTNITGAEYVESVNSTGALTLVNIASTDTGIGLKGDSQTITATYKDLSGSADSINVKLDNATKATINVKANTGTLEANTFEVNGDSSITSFTGFGTKMTVKGEGNLTIGTSSTAALNNNALATFDASELKGAIITGTDITGYGGSTNPDGFVDNNTLKTASGGAIFKFTNSEDNVNITDGANAGSTNTIYLNDGNDKVNFTEGNGNTVMFLGSGDDKVLLNNASTVALTNADVFDFGDGNDTFIIDDNASNSVIVKGLETLILTTNATGTNTITSDSAISVTAQVNGNNVDIEGLYNGSTVTVEDAPASTGGVNALTVKYAQQNDNATIDIKTKQNGGNNVTLSNITDATLKYESSVGASGSTVGVKLNNVSTLNITAAKAAYFGSESATASGTDKLATLNVTGSDVLQFGNITSTKAENVTMSAEKDLTVGTVTASNNLSEVKYTSNTGKVTFGNIGTNTTAELKSVNITAAGTIGAANNSTNNITAAKIGDINITSNTGSVTIGNITSTTSINSVKVSAKGSVSGANIDGTDVGSVNITSTTNAISGFKLGTNSAAKFGDINISAYTNATIVNIGSGTNDTFTNINVTSSTGNITLTNGISAKDSDGFNVTLTSNGTSGTITANTIKNTDGNIGTVKLTSKGAATATITVANSAAAAQQYVEKVDASNVSGGATLTITDNDTATTVTSTTTVLLGGSTNSNTVNMQGTVDNLNVTGSAAGDTVVMGTAANTTFTVTGGTIDLGNGTDKLDFTNFAPAKNAGDGLVINLSSSAQTVGNGTVSAGHVTEWDGTNPVSGGTDLYVKNVENVTGTANADKIFGSSGANVIDGGLGADTITTGDGNDTVILSSPFAAADNITDFTSGSDKVKIDLATGNAGNKFSSPNKVQTSLVANNKLVIFRFATNNGAFSKVDATAQKAINLNSSNATALTAKLFFKGSTISTTANNTHLKINGNNVKVATINKKGVIFFYDTDDHKLEMISIYLKNGANDATLTNATILSKKTIATFAANHDAGATDIAIF